MWITACPRAHAIKPRACKRLSASSPPRRVWMRAASVRGARSVVDQRAIADVRCRRGHRALGRATKTAAISRAHPALFAMKTTTHPRPSRRSSPEAPACTRESPQRQGGKPCSRRKSPPIPAQPESAMTGLSRRRSRVRVPSLPLKTSCKPGSFVADSTRSRRPAFRPVTRSSAREIRDAFRSQKAL